MSSMHVSSQSYQMRRHVPTAVLSRQTAGLRGKSLIMNLPGKPKAIRETIDEVSPPNAASPLRMNDAMLVVRFM